MEYPSVPPPVNVSKGTTKSPEETSKTIVILGYPDVEEQGIPPPPDPTYAGPVGRYFWYTQR